MFIIIFAVLISVTLAIRLSHQVKHYNATDDANATNEAYAPKPSAPEKCNPLCEA